MRMQFERGYALIKYKYSTFIIEHKTETMATSSSRK